MGQDDLADIPEKSGSARLMHGRKIRGEYPSLFIIIQ
jgi:hypothetical protein